MNQLRSSFSAPSLLQTDRQQNEIPPWIFSDSNPPNPQSEIGSSQLSFNMKTIINSAKVLVPRIELKPGSRRASTLTVITSMVGAGTLALPYAMMRAGILPTVCYIIIVAVMCAWALRALIIIGQHTGAHSYYDLANVLFGRKVAITMEVLIIANLVLVSMAYLTMLKNILPLILQNLTHSRSLWDSKFFVVPLVTFVIILFLSLKRRVAALRYTSLLVLLLVCYLMIITIVKFLQYCRANNSCLDHKKAWIFPSTSLPAVESNVPFETATILRGIKLWESSWRGHFYTLPIILTSYTAQPTVLPIYVELHTRSPAEMWIVVSSGVTLTAIIFITLSLFGYLTFLSDTEPNYLMNDYSGDIALLIAGLGFCLVASFGVPLFVHAIRRSIIVLYYTADRPKDSIDMSKPLLNTSEKESSVIGDFPHGNAGQTLAETPNYSFAFRRPKYIREVNKRSSKELPLFAHLLVTLCLLIVICIASLFFPNLGTVMGFLGSTIFPLVGYIFPMLSVWKLRVLEPTQISNKLLVIVSISGLAVSVIAVFGLIEQLLIIM